MVGITRSKVISSPQLLSNSHQLHNPVVVPSDREIRNAIITIPIADSSGLWKWACQKKLRWFAMPYSCRSHLFKRKKCNSTYGKPYIHVDHIPNGRTKLVGITFPIFPSHLLEPEVILQLQELEAAQLHLATATSTATAATRTSQSCCGHEMRPG